MPTLTRCPASQRFIDDGMDRCPSAGFLVSVTVDCSAFMDARRRLAHTGRRITPTAVLVHAAAQALHHHKDLNALCAGGRRYQPDDIDIGVPVAGNSPLAPVMVIRKADTKSAEIIGAEIALRRDQILADDSRLQSRLDTWGRLLPAFVRRLLVRKFFSNPVARHQTVGTLLVGSMPHVEIFAPFLFPSAATLGLGQIQERPVVVDGHIVIRPTAVLTCCADHRIWDGARAVRLLNAVATVFTTSCSETG